MFIRGALPQREQLSSETGDQTLESLQRYERRGVWAADIVNIPFLSQLYSSVFFSRPLCNLKYKLVHVQGRERLAARAQRISTEVNEAK